jgi:hypothetical protein
MPTLKKSFTMRYPVGTRTASAMARIREPGAVSTHTVPMLDALDRALEAWEREHGLVHDLEDMFITVAFSTLSVLVEVSDRMKMEDKS